MLILDITIDMRANWADLNLTNSAELIPLITSCMMIQCNYKKLTAQMESIEQISVSAHSHIFFTWGDDSQPTT